MTKKTSTQLGQISNQHTGQLHKKCIWKVSLCTALCTSLKHATRCFTFGFFSAGSCVAVADLSLAGRFEPAAVSAKHTFEVHFYWDQQTAVFWINSVVKIWTLKRIVAHRFFGKLRFRQWQRKPADKFSPSMPPFAATGLNAKAGWARKILADSLLVAQRDSNCCTCAGALLRCACSGGEGSGPPGADLGRDEGRRVAGIRKQLAGRVEGARRAVFAFLRSEVRLRVQGGGQASNSWHWRLVKWW